MAIAQESFPLHYDVAYPEHLSRWLITVKWLLAIPHLLIESPSRRTPLT